MNSSTTLSKRIFLLSLVLFALLTAVAGFADATVQANKEQTASADQRLQIIRVAYAGYAELDYLITTFDVWEIQASTQSVLLLADKELAQYLHNNDWQVKLEPELTDFHLGAKRSRSIETFFGGYKNNDEIIAELQALNAAYPDLTELVDYGDSLCKILNGCETPGGDPLPGRDLLALRISNEAITGTSVISDSTIISGTKPVFVLDAGIHSRELSVQETGLRFARWMLENYATDPAVKPIVDWQETWIIPVVNPDGFDVVFLGTQLILIDEPLLHRKNGRVTNGCLWPSTVSSHFGVDLNRNFSFGWGTNGTSTNPCSQVFNGAGPASEPEIVALEKLVSQLIPDQRGPNREDVAPPETTGIIISMHSFGEVIIYPWGDGLFPDEAPNADGIVKIANRLGDITGYDPVQGNNFGSGFGVSGASDDHFYGEFGVPSFTLELGTTFLQDYGYTSTTIWNDVHPALLYTASIAREPYQLVNGPELSGITYTVSANQLTISGTASAVLNGNSPIQAVQIQLGQPFALGLTTAFTATAADGAFDSATELFTAGPIDLTQFEACSVDLFFEGIDATAQAGPLQAITVETGSCTPSEPTPTPTPTPTPIGIATPLPEPDSETSYFPIVIRD